MARNHAYAESRREHLAAYARRYRRTEKGKEVNRVGQTRIHAKRILAEGSHTTQEWMDLKAMYGNRCLCCGRSQAELIATLEEDHVIPLSSGGTNWIDNIQPLCEECNSMGGKGIKHTDFRKFWTHFEIDPPGVLQKTQEHTCKCKKFDKSKINGSLYIVD